MVSSRVILGAGSLLLLLACQLSQAAPTNSTAAGSKGGKTDVIPSSARLRNTRQAIYRGSRRNPDYDDDSDAAIAAIPFADEGDKLTDNDEQQKSSSPATTKARRDAANDDQPPRITDDTVNSDESQLPVNADPNREVDVVFVPVIIEEKQIIFIEEDPRQQDNVPDNAETTPFNDDSVTDTTSTDETVYTDSTLGSTFQTTSNPNLVNADEDFAPIVPRPSKKAPLHKEDDSKEVDRRKRDTKSDASSNTTDDSTDLVDFVVSVFQFGPIITAPDEDKSDTSGDSNATSVHVRNARQVRNPQGPPNGNGNGNNNNRNNQPPIPPRSPPRPPPRQFRTTKKPAPRPPPRPSSPADRRPVISPSRGKRSCGACAAGAYGPPPRPNNRGGGGGGGSSSSNAVAQASASSNNSGRGSSSASASANASSSSGSGRNNG